MRGPVAGPLVVPGVQLLDEEQQVGAAMEAARDNPGAVTARQESRTRYEGLDAKNADTVAVDAFPDVIALPSGGVPQLPADEKLTGFENADVATLSLPRGENGVMESAAPIATRGRSGAWTGVNLRLREAGGRFVAANPIVAVQIPKHLQEGAQLVGAGVSVTPVDAQGAPLAGTEGAADGASVFFANTQTDTDTIFKPSSLGLEASTILRGVASPQRLYFHVGLPLDGRLRPAAHGDSAVEVVRAGKTIGMIRDPEATDAAGTDVPVSMAVSGSTLVVSVDHRSGSYRYPIMVDPEFDKTTEELAGEPGYAGNWHIYTAGGYETGISYGELWMNHTGAFGAGDYAFATMQTPGYTKLYAIETRDTITPSYFSSAWIEFPGAGAPGAYYLTPEAEPYVLVWAGTNAPEDVNNNDAVTFELDPTASGSESFSGRLREPTVYLAQEKGRHTEVKSNTWASEIEYNTAEGVTKTPNVLRSGVWFGPHTGAFEFVATDGGLGVSDMGVELYNPPEGWVPSDEQRQFGFPSWGEKKFLKTTSCVAIQCIESERMVETYESMQGNGGSRLPSGEDRIRPWAQSGMPGSTSSEYGGEEPVVKVDSEPPHHLTISGLMREEKKVEIFPGYFVEYPVYQMGETATRVKVEATDGKGSTISSGVKSVAIEIYGHEIGTEGGGCAPGPCTASDEWTINGSELGSGSYPMTVVATDNAGNVATESLEIRVHHASPVAMGPGSVNPESGDFAMEATDVDLSGGMESLTVSRHYDSRNLTEGAEGPLGPQWTLGLGNLAKLEVLPDGSVMLIGPEGLNHFNTKQGGGFEAPEGDANLTLEYNPAKIAYFVRDPQRGTTTEFTLPKGAKQWLPTVSEGAVATDQLTDEYTTIEPEQGKIVVEPTLELAPHPTATCERKALEKLESAAKGCRALEFVYYTETTAKGEGRYEWAGYKNRLEQINAIAYDPTKAQMTSTTVARYVYGSKGRLRAESDPRTISNLQTTYGYDAEGHITGTAAPGQEAWALTYGTTAGDPSTGRLLKATRARASKETWELNGPINLTAPKLSGSPLTGVKMGVSTGSWGNVPIAYGYQWEDCNQGGTECAPILGATNPNYTVGTSDAGHKLVAIVTATNGVESVALASPPSELVGGNYTRTEGEQYPAQPGTTIEYNVPLEGTEVPDQLGVNKETGKPEPEKWAQKDDPEEATAVFPPDEPMGWPATNYKRATIRYMDSQARTVNVANPAGGITVTEYNEDSEVTRTLSAENRATALKEPSPAEASERLDSKNAYNAEGELTDSWGPQHVIKIAQGEKAGEEVLARNHIRYFYDEGAPEGEQYELVTKTIDGAETASKEEVDKRTTVTSYSGQGTVGWKLRKPTSVTVDPGGLNLTTTTKYEELTGNVVETKAPGGSPGAPAPPVYASLFGSVGAGSGQFKEPRGLALDSKGEVMVADEVNNRIDVFNEKSEFVKAFGFGVSNGEAKLEVCTTSCKAGTAGSGNGQLSGPRGVAVDSKGDIWVADSGNSRVEEFNEKAEFVKTVGAAGGGGGQFKEPKGITVDSHNNVWIADTENARVQELNEKGEFVKTFGFGVSNGESKFQICTSSCKAGIAGSGPGQLWMPRSLAVASNGAVWVADTENSRVEVFKETGAYEKSVGSAGSGIGQFNEPKGITIDSRGNAWVADGGNNRVEEFNEKGEYVLQFGTKGTGNGQFQEPWAVLATARGELYVTDGHNNRIQKFAPAVSPGNPEAHDTKTIYYTAHGEAEVEACREHIEWVGLPCETAPVAQPGAGGVPGLELPTTKTTYNIWDQAETITETFGTTTRTRKNSYDYAGQPVSTEESASIDTPLATVNDKYNSANGSLEQVSTTVGETTRTITSLYNTRGQLTTYTDADGATATYTYEQENDARLTGISYEIGKQAFSQTYGYSETTGAMTELTDSGAGSFKVSRDVEGNIVTESYPNGMTAYYSHNAADKTTGVEYKKETHCTEHCVWFSDTTVPGIHGETLKQASTLSEEPTLTYDAAGRLTAVQETPAGGGCKTRLYGYDVEGNRTSQTTREPGAEGKCASEGGSTERHVYDTGNRLADAEVAYEPFGNTTKLPSPDAGEHEMTASYYVDGQVYKQTQAEETFEYKLDPEDRTRETISSGKTAATVITHYDAPGNATSWTSEGGENWTRDIPGIGGELAAVQTKAKTVLELHDLQGNIVATAATSEAETKLLSTYNSTEFGVPTSKEAPPHYAWLGAAGVTSELSSGAITQDGITYVPQTGRPLQTQPVEVPLPVNEGTPFVSKVAPWVIQSGVEAATRQVAAAEEARRAQEQAGCNGGTEGCGPDPEGGAEASSPFSASLSIEEGTGAVAAYARSFVLTPGQAIGASRAVGVINKGVFENPYFPGWANQVLKNIPYVDWNKLADDLFAGGTAASPLGAVEVTIEGTLKPKHFHLFILVKAISDYDY
jgi:hypothetical protein